MELTFLVIARKRIFLLEPRIYRLKKKIQLLFFLHYIGISGSWELQQLENRFNGTLKVCYWCYMQEQFGCPQKIDYEEFRFLKINFIFCAVVFDPPLFNPSVPNSPVFYPHGVGKGCRGANGLIRTCYFHIETISKDP